MTSYNDSMTGFCRRGLIDPMKRVEVKRGDDRWWESEPKTMKEYVHGAGVWLALVGKASPAVRVMQHGASLTGAEPVTGPVSHSGAPGPLSREEGK